MNFKYKALIQNIFSSVYKGERVNYFFQKHITKSLPISDKDFSEKLDTVKLHFDNFKKYNTSKEACNSIYYEFGTGYDMVIPLFMSLLGFKEMICVDIRELVFPELINDSIHRLKNFSEKLECSIDILDTVPEINKNNYKEILKNYFRIKYIAPVNAKETNIENDSVDFILSNATMEHIPANDLKGILKECYRILNRNGIMSNVIDYRDHWSFFDNSISIYNYLKFSERTWKKFNPSIMYQNRLRHKDYTEIIKSLGFEIICERVDYPSERELSQLKEIELNEKFKKSYSIEELSIKSSMLVLRKT